MILESLGGILAGQAFGRLRERVRPNPMAPDLPRQSSIAAIQASGTGLRPGTSGLAGSEADYYTDAQGVGTIGRLDYLVQDVTSRAMPPSTYMPGDPGADPADPTVLADFNRRPVILPVDPWGAYQYSSMRPNVLADRINEPTAQSPLPRDVAMARAAGAPQGLVDAFDAQYDDGS